MADFLQPKPQMMELLPLQPLLGLSIDQQIYPLCLTPDGSGIWCAFHYRGFDKTQNRDEVCLLETLPHVKKMIVLDDKAHSCALHPEGLLLATGHYSRDMGSAQITAQGIRIWDITNRQIMWERNDFSGGIFSADGKYLLSGGQSEVRIFDYQRNEVVAHFDGTRVWNVCKLFVACHPYAEFIAVAFAGDSTSVIRFADAKLNWQPREEWDIHCKADIVSSGVFSENGQFFAFCDGDVHLYSFAPPQYLTSLKAHDGGLKIERRSCNPGPRSGRINSIQFTPDSSTLICCASDGQIILWDVATGLVKFQVKGHEGRILGANLSRDGKTLVTSGEDRVLSIWKLNL